MVRLLAGLGFLFLLFLPAPPAIGRLPVLDHRLPLEALIILGLLAALALTGRRLPRLLRWLLAFLVLLVAILHLVDAEGPALMGRDLDLAADLGHVSSVFSLFAGAASLGQIIAGTVVAIVLPLLLIVLTAWALAGIEASLARSRWLAAAMLILCIGVGTALANGPFLSTSSWASLSHQGRSVLDDWRVRHGERDAFVKALGPAPRRDADLKVLDGNDVYVIFFESYGAVLLDDPALRSEAAPAMAKFGAALASAGFTLRTARIASPTYGGGSWLAHGTVDSGTWLNSQLRYQVQTTTDRPSWPRLMAKAGYATMDAQPGLKTPLDSAPYWGFDQMIGTDEFGYEGPAFGWFGLPDQFSLDKIAQLPRGSARPLFLQIVLISSHLPFAPVPPFVEDRRDIGTFATHPEVRGTAPPDWSNLAAPYLKSVSYDLETLADWLPRAIKGNGLVIILGDHQPPALIGAASASHDVPIHILSRDGELVRRLAGAGYADGAFPGGSAGTMADLLPRFLDAYSTPRS